MTLEERIEAAAKAGFAHIFAGVKRLDGMHVWDVADQRIKDGFTTEAAVFVAAAFPELFTSPPTAWLAPWEADEGMLNARDGNDENITAEADYAAMRDHRLNSGA